MVGDASWLDSKGPEKRTAGEWPTRYGARMDPPNILLIMTDEDATRRLTRSAAWRHFVARTDCPRVDQEHTDVTGTTPGRPHARQAGRRSSRDSTPRFTGVNSTDGTAKQNSDPGMHWLDPAFRAHARRLVPRRGLPDALQGKVAHLVRRPRDSHYSRRIEGVG